jgi:hypothetical protein
MDSVALVLGAAALRRRSAAARQVGLRPLRELD